MNAKAKGAPERAKTRVISEETPHLRHSLVGVVMFATLIALSGYCTAKSETRNRLSLLENEHVASSDTYVTASTDPSERFMEGLWTVWEQDIGRAVLAARKYWQVIPASIDQQSNEIKSQAQVAQRNQTIRDVVGTQLGILGIPAGMFAGTDGLGMTFDRAWFVLTMAEIRQNRGDPPAKPGMEQFAQGVLRGQIDPIQALIACTPGTNPQLFASVLQMAQNAGLPQLEQLFKIAAVIEAAKALPREQLSEFVPDVPAVGGH